MKNPINTRKRFLGERAVAFCGIVLIAVAGLHRLQLDTTAPHTYTSSPLVPVELGLILLMFLMLVASFFRLLYLLVKRRWRDSGILAIGITVGFACIIVALHIDAPTLLYRT